MIAIQNLSYQYTHGKAMFFPDFELSQGAHCLLLGESGSGKTTLLHLLGGLLKVQKGSVVISSTILNELSGSALDHFRGRHIGFVFQKNHLISSLSVRKNLLLSPWLGGLPQDASQVEKILSQLGIADTISAKITQLSQGQLQRVAIARAVLNNPSVIFADEPTSALDDKNCERVIQLLTDVANENNITLVVATHDQRLKTKIRHQIVLTETNQAS
jgi:ABC-type lipoprotein export system ATPase subunit